MKEFRVAWLDGGKILFDRMGTARAGEDPMQGMTALVGTPGASFNPILGPNVTGGASFNRTAFPIVTASRASDWLIGFSRMTDTLGSVVIGGSGKLVAARRQRP